VGKSGLAHLVEHLLVTSAAGSTPARTYADILALYPAGHTAQTADRHTIVAGIFPPERLEAEVKDAAGRLGDLKIVVEDLAREKPRVLDEVANMFERMPALAAQNRAREALLPNRAGGRRAGDPEHVRNLTLADVTEFWKRHYKPGNAVLALAGALDAAAAKALVTQAFGGIPRGDAPPVPPAPPTRLAPPLEPFDVKAPAPGGSSRVCVAYAAPPPSSPDYAAFLLFVARLLEAKMPREGFTQPVTFAPLDEPGAVYLAGPLAAGEAWQAGVARLQAFASAAVGQPWSPTDPPRVEQAYGLLLGLKTPGDWALAGNPYVVALGLAARRVLGIDPEALAKAVDGLKTAPLAEMGARLFDPLQAGVGVVRVKP
jgi:zinc protease